MPVRLFQITLTENQLEVLVDLIGNEVASLELYFEKKATVGNLHSLMAAVEETKVIS